MGRGKEGGEEGGGERERGRGRERWGEGEREEGKGEEERVREGWRGSERMREVESVVLWS